MNTHRETSLRGTLRVPGDKSISHRSLMFGALAEGKTEVHHFLPSDDCLHTMACLRELGAAITEDSGVLTVGGKGLHSLKAPSKTLDAGNSGTTTRLLSGILAGQTFSSEIDGDSSLRSRPMNRIMKPLGLMGGHISSRNDDGCAPLIIQGSPLKGITYHTPVASAQVKSCLILAGLYAEGETRIIEPSLSRDHTERMLRAFGADLFTENDGTICLRPGRRLEGQKINVPGDISSAAYFLAAGLLLPDSEIRLENVGINPSRDGLLRVIRAMGGRLEYDHVTDEGEPSADLIVRTSQLHGTDIGGDIIPTLIDEIPMIAVMAAFAEGETIIRDAGELKVKETDRLSLITENLSRMGAAVTATEDGMIIRGGRPLHGADIDVQGDHRLAMAFTIAGLMTEGVRIADTACASVSYPDFYAHLKKLSH